MIFYGTGGMSLESLKRSKKYEFFNIFNNNKHVVMLDRTL